MNADLKTGIIVGMAIVVPGIAYAPSGNDPVVAATICAGLGGLALLGAAWRHHPAAVGLSMTAVALLGGYSLMAGLVSGGAGVGVGLLALAATAALVVRVLPARPVRRAVNP